ncbi:SatD family protein [Spirochaeta cellobiosiphila]|uniref:SatD family protein n=1 Tax=Spirochaeta cellobiosiphila TaxID=504483 RepID=UPI0005672AFC|nr:SatD family protein [Spirochaeta cellobiosiphila]
MKLIAIIADIVGSKEIEDRYAFQEDLKEKLATINSLRTNIISPFTITLGDEFQALYKNCEGLIWDIFNIMHHLYPYQVRVAIGRDEILTEINEIESIGMDGPAFYLARDGLEGMKKEKMNLLQFYERKGDGLLFINESLKLVMSFMNDWKPNTMHIFQNLIEEKAVKVIADEINISERGVYKIMETQKLKGYLEYMKSLDQQINLLWKNND